MRFPRRSVPIALALTVLASCTPEAPLAPAADIEHTVFATSLGIDLAAMTKTASGLYFQDGTVGGGTTVISGYHVTVHYTLYLANGTVVQTSVGGAPFGFTVGTTPPQVIAGFDEGLLGMKAGGTRKLVIPPALGYGAVQVQSIPPNSVLIYSIQLLSVP